MKSFSRPLNRVLSFKKDSDNRRDKVLKELLKTAISKTIPVEELQRRHTRNRGNHLQARSVYTIFPAWIDLEMFYFVFLLPLIFKTYTRVYNADLQTQCRLYLEDKTIYYYREQGQRPPPPVECAATIVLRRPPRAVITIQGSY